MVSWFLVLGSWLFGYTLILNFGGMQLVSVIANCRSRIANFQSDLFRSLQKALVSFADENTILSWINVIRCQISPRSLSSATSFCLFPSSIEHIGERNASFIIPISASAVFTGIGFDSMKRRFIRLRYL